MAGEMLLASANVESAVPEGVASWCCDCWDSSFIAASVMSSASTSMNDDDSGRLCEKTDSEVSRWSFVDCSGESV